MREASYPGLGSVLVESSWQEQASKAYCLIVQACHEAGIKIQQHETSDIQAAETLAGNMADYLVSWQDGAIASAEAGTEIAEFDESFLPEIAQFLGLALTGQWGLVFVLFVKVGLRVIMERQQRTLPDANTGDIEQVLKDIFAVLDPSTGEIVGSKLEGLTQLQLIINNVLSEAERQALYEVGSTS